MSELGEGGEKEEEECVSEKNSTTGFEESEKRQERGGTEVQGSESSKRCLLSLYVNGPGAKLGWESGDGRNALRRWNRADVSSICHEGGGLKGLAAESQSR